MHLLEVREGLTLNLDEVEAVEKKGKFSCTITINGEPYIVEHPYETIIAMLQKGSNSFATYQRP